MQHAPDLTAKFDALVDTVENEARGVVRAWEERISRPAFSKGANNLAHYLAFRRRDLRDLQRELMVLGLSSLGRLEGRVMPGLRAVRASLADVSRGSGAARPSRAEFFAGEKLLAAHAAEMFGASATDLPVALLVTCPTEAGDDPGFMLELAKRKVNAIRINCAHDDAEVWSRMVGHAHAASRATGHRLRVFMDLGGPKIRTGRVRVPPADDHAKARLAAGDSLALVAQGRLDEAPPEAGFAAECTLAEALHAAQVGQKVFYDDGKLGAEITAKGAWGLMLRVDVAREKGVKLKPEKGLNFPESELDIEALTETDRRDLAFVARHADAIGLSFVQTARDVAALQEALAELRDDWQRIGLVLKIETPRAVRELPEVMVQAAGRQPTAVMIARGDLAVEIGFARTAEMQEEILWLAEAAHVPAIWATQVLENLVKTGTPTRAEMTDAAVAARAECVMLNKGPHLLEAIDVLQKLFARMEQNVHKKTPLLRRLQSW